MFKFQLIKALTIVMLLLPFTVIGKTWQVNLKEADINIFVRQVAEMTNKSFIVDPRVKGNVTVISNSDLDEDGVFRLFLSVLTVHGYAVVESPEGFKILPQNVAKQSGLNYDQDGNSSGELLVTRVIAIKNAVASELVPILRPLIPQYGHLASVASMNALIISDHAENIRSLELLVDKLDSTIEGSIEVITLEHAWATDVIDLIDQLNATGNNRTSKSKKTTTSSVTVIADERTNRLIVKGKPGQIAQILTLVDTLDIPVEKGKKTSRLQFIPLQYADAAITATLLKGLVFDEDTSSAKSDEGKKGEPAATKTNIQADEELNALLINAEPDVMAEINSVLKNLDVPRAQVLVEAIIVEIRVENTDEVGVQWLIANSAGDAGAGTSFTAAGNSLDSLLDSDTTLSTGGTAVLGSSSFGLILQALSSQTNSNLLSTPKILTLDNQKSRIQVGETRPFQTGEYTDDGDSTYVTTTREDVGLTLEVTPHINSSNEVRLEVLQTVEAASDEVSDLGTITTIREIETIVVAKDGQTIVLGGLIEDDISEVKQKVPFLGDLPFIGALFRSSSYETTKINLLVFIRPTILRGKADLNQVTNIQYRGFRAVELQMSGAREGGIEGLFEPELVE